MKRLSAILLSLILILSLAACGGVNKTETQSDTGNSGSPGTSGGTERTSGDVSLTGEISGEITVSTYDTMKYRAYLEEAARLFEEQYPGTTVNIETFSAMPDIKTSSQGGKSVTAIQMQDDPQGRQDYINKINTALMSGGGADVLAMDVLPIHKYAESGQLENLAAYMEADPDFDRSDYRENILDAIEYNGGTWFLPTDYTFEYFAYDSSLLEPDTADFGTASAFSTSQLIDMVKDAYNGSTKLFNTPDFQRGMNSGMWGNLLAENYASFVDLMSKTARFDDGNFAQVLKSVKQYGEQGYIPRGSTGQKDAGAMIRQSGESPTDRFYFKPKNVFSLINQFTRGADRKMNIITAGGAIGIEEDDEIAGIRASADGSVPFTYEQAYGINSNSQNKQTAWAFIKFLLSEEMQLNTNLSPLALPLRNSAREKKAESIFSGSFMGQQGQALDEPQLDALRNYQEAVEQLSDQINSYTWKDTVVNDMIAAEVQFFFDGSKTAGEVADALQNKVGLYLNE